MSEMRSNIPAQYERALIDISGTSANTIIAAVTGKYIKVWAMELNVVAATTVNFLSNATSLSGAQSWDAKETRKYEQILPVPNASRALPIFRCALDEPFKITLGTDTPAKGWILYTLETSP